MYFFVPCLLRDSENEELVFETNAFPVHFTCFNVHDKMVLT